MLIGIFAKTFAATGASASLEAVHAAGYDAAQFNMAIMGGSSMPASVAPDTCREIAQASARTRVGIAAVSGTYNMIHPDPEIRADGLSRLSVLLRAAPAMGTRLVTLCTGTRDPHDQWRHHPDNATPQAWRDLLTEMAKAVSLAEDCGVDLGIEPELANVVSSADRARRLIDELASPRLRIVLDPANLFETASGADIRRTIEHAVDCLGDRIVMAHAKDRLPDGSFAAAGTGVVDFAHFVRSLRAAGFDGPLVTHGLSEAQAPSVAAFLKRTVAEAAAA